MVIDKNGKTSKAGDIVKIENSFFKNDNGYWLVEEDGTNPAYLGKDNELTLKGSGKTGKLLTSKYKTVAFWPAFCCTSDKWKNAEAREWNKEHATIEIVDEVDNAQAVAWIKEQIEAFKERIKQYEWNGWNIELEKGRLEYTEKMLAHMTV
jgi:hypothetical protein